MVRAKFYQYLKLMTKFKFEKLKIKKVILFAFLLFLQFHIVDAATVREMVVTPTEIYQPLTEISLLPKDKQESIASLLPAIFSADFEGSNCTGTFISHEGHLLTADHCIQSCFKFDGETWEDYIEYRLYEDPSILKAPKTLDYFTFKRFRAEKIRDKYLCDVRINGQMKKANLIVSGKGRLFPYSLGELQSKNLKDQYKTLLSKGIWAASDFAILQLTEKPKTACIPLGKREPRPMEQLRAVSYTCIPTPLHPDNRNGDVPLYTEGILATPDFFTRESAAELTNGSTPNNTFWSNLAAETCSSGSAVIGSDGTILGVFNMLTYGSDKFGPATNLVRVSGVAEILAGISAQAQSITCD